MTKNLISIILILFFAGWVNIDRPLTVYAEFPQSEFPFSKVSSYRVENLTIDETHHCQRFYDENNQLAQEKYFENGKLTNKIFFFDLGDWELYRQGEKLVTLGKYDEARPIFEEAVQERPEKSILHFKLGVIYERMKYYELAKEQYRAAISNGVFDDMARIGLGNVNLMAGDYEDAIKVYQEVLYHDPRDINARYGVAYAYSSLGDWSKSEAELEKVFNADPLYPGAQELKEFIAKHIKSQ